MNEAIPKWAQPPIGPRICSVCGREEAHFGETRRTEVIMELKDGRQMPCVNLLPKSWLKERFDEHGGNL